MSVDLIKTKREVNIFFNLKTAYDKSLAGVVQRNAS